MLNSPDLRRAFLAKLRAANPIAALIKHGFSPDDVHALVLRTLSPHFTNQNVLNFYALSALVPQAVNVLYVQERQSTQTVLQQCIDIRRRAIVVNRTDSIALAAEFQPDTAFGVSEVWSAINLERTAASLPIHEFKTEVFRMIGMIVEASLQPFLRELLGQLRISKGLTADPQTLRRLTLGNVVQDLSSLAGLPDLVTPPPWNVRLNQWRNVAQHHLAKVDGNELVISAKAAKTSGAVRLSRTTTLEVARVMVLLFTAVKAASEIVIADVTGGAWPCCHDAHGVRAEAILLHFSSAISTQGFELLDLEVTDRKVRADFTNILDGEELGRIAHASQLIQLLIAFLPRPSTEIRYFDARGQLRASAAVDDLDQDAVAKGLLTSAELMSQVAVRFYDDDSQEIDRRLWSDLGR